MAINTQKFTSNFVENVSNLENISDETIDKVVDVIHELLDNTDYQTFGDLRYLVEIYRSELDDILEQDYIENNNGTIRNYLLNYIRGLTLDEDLKKDLINKIRNVKNKNIDKKEIDDILELLDKNGIDIKPIKKHIRKYKKHFSELYSAFKDSFGDRKKTETVVPAEVEEGETIEIGGASGHFLGSDIVGTKQLYGQEIILNEQVQDTSSSEKSGEEASIVTDEKSEEGKDEDVQVQSSEFKEGIQEDFSIKKVEDVSDLSEESSSLQSKEEKQEHVNFEMLEELSEEKLKLIKYVYKMGTKKFQKYFNEIVQFLKNVTDIDLIRIGEGPNSFHGYITINGKYKVYYYHTGTDEGVELLMIDGNVVENYDINTNYNEIIDGKNIIITLENGDRKVLYRSEVDGKYHFIKLVRLDGSKITRFNDFRIIGQEENIYDGSKVGYLEIDGIKYNYKRNPYTNIFRIYSTQEDKSEISPKPNNQGATKRNAKPRRGRNRGQSRNKKLDDSISVIGVFYGIDRKRLIECINTNEFSGRAVKIIIPEDNFITENGIPMRINIISSYFNSNNVIELIFDSNKGNYIQLQEDNGIGGGGLNYDVYPSGVIGNLRQSKVINKPGKI